MVAMSIVEKTMSTWGHDIPPVNSSADFGNTEHIPGQMRGVFV